MNMTRHLAVLVLPALTSLASAQQQQQEVIVVTANRIAQPLGSAAAGITVIDRAAIADSMAQSLNDLLMGQPGIHLAQSGGVGSQTSLFMRGTESDHTLVLIDGVGVNTSTGTSARLENLSPDQIERIEIVRGPRSGIYGSEALGGVLQIFTRKPSEQSVAGSASLMTGTEQSGSAGVHMSGREGGSAMALGFTRRRTDGIDASITGSPDRDGFRDESVSLQFEQQMPADALLSFSAGGSNAESEYDDGDIEADSHYLRGSFTLPATEAWTSLFSVEEFAEDNANRGAFGDTDSQTRSGTLRWQNDVLLPGGARISLGTDYQQQRLDYESPGAMQDRDSRRNSGFYLGYFARLDKVDVELSLRQDSNQRFGSHTSGNAGVAWSLNGTTILRASYGSGFKAPNLLDLYVDFPAFGFYANPDLQPERSRAYELGIQKIWAGSSLELSLFRTDISELITSDASFTTLVNVDRARIDGAELSVARSLMDWDLTVDLTLLKHSNRTTGQELLRRPERTFRLAALRRLGSLQFGIDLLAQGDHSDFDPVSFQPSRVPGYGIINAVANVQLGEQLVLRLRGGNLFDKRYEVVDGYHSYGRTFQAALELSF